jgi:hypothetical protein
MIFKKKRILYLLYITNILISAEKNSLALTTKTLSPDPSKIEIFKVPQKQNKIIENEQERKKNKTIPKNPKYEEILASRKRTGSLDKLSQNVNHKVLETNSLFNKKGDECTSQSTEDDIHREFIGIDIEKINELYEELIQQTQPPVSVNTCIGDHTISFDFLIELLNCNALKRMEGVDQGGTTAYFDRGYPFSRKEHMETTFAAVFTHTLAKKLDQIGKETSRLNKIETIIGFYASAAALIHDVSHSAFSHLGDVVKENNHGSYTQSMQDKEHITFLIQSDINTICKKYNVDIKFLDPDLHRILEAPYGEMSADRFYNINTALAYLMASKEDCQKMFKSLNFGLVPIEENGKIVKRHRWYFTDLIYAKQYGYYPLVFMTEIWNSYANFIEYRIFAEVIKHAISKKIINWKDFEKGTDAAIMKKLEESGNPFILYILNALKKENFDSIYTLYTGNEPKQFDNYDEHKVSKFRGIDPLIYTSQMNVAERLSQHDLNGYGWNISYEQSKKNCKDGHYIKYNILIFPIAFYYYQQEIEKLQNECISTEELNQGKKFYHEEAMKYVYMQIKFEELIKNSLSKKKKEYIHKDTTEEQKNKLDHAGIELEKTIKATILRMIEEHTKTTNKFKQKQLEDEMIRHIAETIKNHFINNSNLNPEFNT